MTSPTMTVLPSPGATSLLSSPESITSTQSTRSCLRTPMLHIPTAFHHQASTVPREIDLITLPRTEPIQPTQPAEMKHNNFEMLVGILPLAYCTIILFPLNFWTEQNFISIFFQVAYQTIMTRTKDDLLDEIEAIRLSIERYNAWRERYLKWGFQYDWVTDVVRVRGCIVIPEMVPSLHLTVEDVNILPLQQHDKEPATWSQHEEPNKTTISIPNTFCISAYF